MPTNEFSRKSGPGAHNRVSDETGGDQQVGVADLIGALLKRKKVIAGIVLVAMVITIPAVLLTPNKYCSRASIMPSGAVDRFASLRDLAGIGGAVSNDENSSTLFPVIIRSNMIQDAILNKTYSFMDEGASNELTLQDYFDQDNRDILRRELGAITTVSMDKNTGVISLEVETTLPGLSQTILQQYLCELEDFNLSKRRSRGRENAEYLEKQVTNATAELANAENELRDFQSVNRNWPSSTDPDIIIGMSGLQREVELKSRTYLFLVQEREIAKLDAQKDVPIVRILDSPNLPTLKSSPHRTMIVLLAGAVAFMLAAMFVLASWALKDKRLNRGSYQVLRRDIAEAFPRSVRVLNLVRGTETQTHESVRERVEA